MPKGSKNTVQARIEQVLRIRLLGGQYHDIVQYASENDPPWNVGERQIRNYIERADELLSQELAGKRRRFFNLAIGKRRPSLPALSKAATGEQLLRF